MQQPKRKTLTFLSTMLLFLLASCGGGAPKVDWQIHVTGDVATPLDISYKELAAMPQIDLSGILMEKSTGEDEITSWSGVPITEILEQAGVTDYSSITAFASDGYAVEITADEMQGAIIAMKDSGEWIADVTPDKGPIRLVCPQTPASRWVFQLQELQINK